VAERVERERCIDIVGHAGPSIAAGASAVGIDCEGLNVDAAMNLWGSSRSARRCGVEEITEIDAHHQRPDWASGLRMLSVADLRVDRESRESNVVDGPRLR
jgi:hypothetical protein